MSFKPHIVIVTGLSGSGKSTVIKAFEDIGYFCIDNIPIPLLPELLKLCTEQMTNIQKIALGIDIRERSFLKSYNTIFQKIEKSGYPLEIIFLEASVEILQRRYSQTRRVHPLELEIGGNEERNLLKAINKERELLESLRKRASRIIDTSELTVHMLKNLIVRTYGVISEKDLLSVQLLSFGYKYGIPLESDIVIDLRFLPNPYFVDQLRSLTGCSPEVSRWIMEHEETKKFIELAKSFFEFLIPLYVREGKKYLNISFGCTGGKHRSVAMVEYFKRWLTEKGYYVKAFHRDVGNE